MGKLSVYHGDGGMAYDAFVWHPGEGRSLGLRSDPRWLPGSVPDTQQVRAGTPSADLGLDALWCLDYGLCQGGTHGHGPSWQAN